MLASTCCKTALFISGAEGIRTPDLRRAKAAQYFASGFWSLQNSCKSAYFLLDAFPEFSGDLLGLLHGCCTIQCPWHLRREIRFETIMSLLCMEFWFMRICVDLMSHNGGFRNKTLQVDKGVPIWARCGTLAACCRDFSGSRCLPWGSPDLIFNGSMFGWSRWSRF